MVTLTNGSVTAGDRNLHRKQLLSDDPYPNSENFQTNCLKQLADETISIADFRSKQ
jgi:hypothetical protein